MYVYTYSYMCMSIYIRPSVRAPPPKTTHTKKNMCARTGAEDDEGDVRRVVLDLVGARTHVKDEGARQGRVTRGGLHG